MASKSTYVPGSFWEGRQAAEEKSKFYKCSIRGYFALHTFPDKSVGQGMELQEMGESGTGSLENGETRVVRSLVSAAVNKKAFKPSHQAIKEMYYKLFRGKALPDFDLEPSPETEVGQAGPSGPK